MGDGTLEHPYTREDVLRLIEENGGTAMGLNLSGKVFEEALDLSLLSLKGINLEEATLKEANLQQSSLWDANLQKAFLRDANLQGANLRDAHLQGANLRDAHLEGAFLVNAHLERADLRDAHLEGAHLLCAHLEGTHLRDAHLERADLLGAHLEGAHLRDAHLERADLRDAHLEGADLLGAHLEGTHLRDAHLEGAHLRDTHLEGADLLGAHLEGAHLRDAHLEGAHLRDAHLEGADLLGAHLEGTHLRDAKLQGAYLRDAKFSSETKLENADWGNYILGEEKPGFFSLAADTYRRLKQRHTSAGMYDIAGKFFFREMTAKRKAMEWWPKPWNRAWSNFVSFICGYGERPLWVVRWAASVVFVLAFVYLAIDSLWGLLGWNFWDSLYFSAVSFSALGYGSWLQMTNDIASDWIRGIGALESFIGISAWHYS